MLNVFVFSSFLLLTCGTDVDSKAVVDSPCNLDIPGMQFYPVLGDCSSFWICRNGNGKKVQCLSGSYYNQKTKLCNNRICEQAEMGNLLPQQKEMSGGFFHPDCPSKDPKEPVIISHDNDCGKFYICSGGVAHEKTCLTGLHFNRKLMVCDYPQSAKCDSKVKLLRSNVNCPATDSMTPTLLPHEQDCTTYYMCVNGAPIVRSCPNGLHFNRQLLLCDYPDKAGCTETRGRNFDITEGDVVTSTTYNTGSPSPFCPTVDGKLPVFFPHETDCSVYYMCGNGLAYEFVCPKDLHFNVKIKTCDVPRKAKCLDRQQRAVQSPMCPSINDEKLTILPHENDCAKYYMCESGVPIERSCPDGLHYNPEDQVCDFQEKAGCTLI